MMQTAKLLTEIVLEIFSCEHANPVPSKQRNEHKSTRFVFDAIRICQDEGDARYLRHYKMGVLLQLLPLAALYNCGPVLGAKTGLFLAELSALKARSNFSFTEWLDINMLQVHHNAPDIFKSAYDDEYELR